MDCRIVKTVSLKQIDFDNFSSDLLADRPFLEDNAASCTQPGDCLLVTCIGHAGELLVIPSGCHVRYAAHRPCIVTAGDHPLPR